jgi:hypothetical protein
MALVSMTVRRHFIALTSYTCFPSGLDVPMPEHMSEQVRASKQFARSFEQSRRAPPAGQKGLFEIDIPDQLGKIMLNR